jgi:hypothetical protein
MDCAHPAPVATGHASAPAAPQQSALLSAFEDWRRHGAAAYPAYSN